MPKTTFETISDQEFARQVGIPPDFSPRLSLGRKLLLALVLLLAGSTTIFAGLFQAWSATGGDNLQTSVTQCPMTGNPSKPAR